VSGTLEKELWAAGALDAVEAFQNDLNELSIHAPKDFRRTSHIRKPCVATTISGKGTAGYRAALRHLSEALA
jgi:3-dehydroquinate dehydratase